MNKGVVNTKTTHFLIGSFCALMVISIIAFLALGVYMNRASERTINAVGDLYMSGMSDRISAHFQTIIGSKFDQAEATVKVVDADNDNIDELYKDLAYRAHVRDFDYLALCSETGEVQMLYGDSIQLVDPEPFYASLRNNQKKVAVGLDSEGNNIVLFGVSADYPMSNGQKCMAMIAAMPADYITTMLSMDQEDALVHSHIIRKDGSFVIHDSSVDYPDYFSVVRERQDDDKMDEAEEFIENLTASMEAGENYSDFLQFDGNRQQIYSTMLANSEWYLVTALPYGVLNETVNSLSRQRLVATFVAFAIIATLMLLIFFRYFHLIRIQLQEVEESRQIALQATKAKSEFLSNMSHDIRTPMNAIVGMTAIATAHIDDKEQVQNCLKKISLSGRHLLGLINDVLDMSKIESGKMTLSMDQISLPEVVEGIVGIVQSQVHGKKQSFNVHVDNIEVESVYCDSVRLNQVLLNLLSNAVKYTQEGGSIWFSLYEEESPKGEEYVRVCIKVEDNGIGMDEEFQAKIFDSYSRADSKRVHKTEGAGLGMAITKYIVDAMEGTIKVESELGKGTKFHLTLDLEKAEVPEDNMMLPAWKMLVVDDDEMSCQTTVTALKDIGVAADWTLSGEKAIELVEQHHKKQDDYQIILLDWKLPGMNGIQVAREIRRSLGHNVSILLISAYDWSEFETEARDAGVDGFISKPLFKSTLYYGLQKYMGAEESAESLDKQKMDLSGRRILVAEDNDLNWEVLHELLSDIGMELEWAENGQICVDMFTKSDKGYYDAILMDVRMPVMNGYEATTAIRALERADAHSIPIIAMTADAFSEDVQRCLDCGMNAHTAKPINLEEVLFLLRKYFSVE
ncbi:MAG: response regulator [Lachnospiraceae bacterium]|nr:response regulator [Lachnospiraceae bacterium]